MSASGSSLRKHSVNRCARDLDDQVDLLSRCDEGRGEAEDVAVGGHGAGNGAPLARRRRNLGSDAMAGVEALLGSRSQDSVSKIENAINAPFLTPHRMATLAVRNILRPSLNDRIYAE